LETLSFRVDSPRVGHPAKEGLRLRFAWFMVYAVIPREGQPLKEGLRQRENNSNAV
jgi:hypothetical protein